MRPRTAVREWPTIGAADVKAAIDGLRDEAAESQGAVVLIELALRGARRIQLVALIAASIDWPPSATLRALPRPDLVVRIPSKRRPGCSTPLRPSPEAAGWIAKRARTTPAPAPIFTEAMFLRAMSTLRKKTGGEVGWHDVRRHAAREADLRARSISPGESPSPTDP